MLSNHTRSPFATEFNWVIASLIFVIGVLIRHYFNSMHARKGNPPLDLGRLGGAVPDHHLAVDRAFRADRRTPRLGLGRTLHGLRRILPPRATR